MRSVSSLKFWVLWPLKRYNAFFEKISDSQFHFLLLLIFTVPLTAYYLYCNLTIQWSFLTIACDTAAYQSALVNTLAGSFFRATAYGGPNMLGGHTSFSLLAAAPFYYFFPYPETLFTLQDISICGAVIPLYLYALERGLSPGYSFFVCALYLINPLVLHMIFAPFHPECFVGTVVITLLYAYQKNWSRLFWLLIIFALGCGEEAAPTLVGLGLFLYVSKDQLPWRITYARRLLFFGIGWLFLSIFVLLPLFQSPGLPTNVVSHYDNWDVHSDRELPLALLLHPLKTLSLLFSFQRWGYVGFLVGLPIFLIPFRPRTIFILAPFPIFFLMQEQQFFMYFHSYYFQFAIVAATVAAIQFLQQFQSLRFAQITLLMGCMVNLFLSFLTSEYYLGLYHQKDDLNETAILHQVFDSIPKSACVYAPHRFSVYLSARPNMVMGDLQGNFKTCVEDSYPSTHLHAEQVDYIVCYVPTDQCGVRFSQYNRAESDKRSETVLDLLKSGMWKVYWRSDDASAIVLCRSSIKFP